MKKVLEKSIINLDDNYFDNIFVLKIQLDKEFANEFDISKLILPHKNESLNYKKDYKLWSQVYSPKDELKIFNELIEYNLKKNIKIHISNISLSEEIDIIKKLYIELWYFDKELNCFIVDWENVPVTIWVNINNVIYSFKDYKSKKEKILLIPPPREPRHQKVIKSSINSWLISVIDINGKEDVENIKQIIKEEKASLTRLASCFYYNYIKIGFRCESDELIINI